MSLSRPTAAWTLFVYLSRRRSRHPIGFQLFILFIKSCNNIIVGMRIIIFVHDAFMHTFIISFVRLSCVYFQSTHLACWFGQMLMKAISWMKSSIASPTPRGVPVSPLRSWSWSLFYNRFRLPPNKFIGSHSDTRWTIKYWSHTTHFTVTYAPPLLLRVSSYATLPVVSYPPLCIISACL